MLILVIDDDELSRELLTLLLEVDGYQVVSAASGDEALSRLKDLDPSPDAILTDLQMPGTSGTELAQQLRALLSAGIPIIAMSGSDSRPPGTLAGPPPGFNGFLLKPFPVADLKRELEAAARDLGSIVAASLSSTTPSERRSTTAVEENEGPVLNEEVFLKMQELMPSAQLHQMYTLCIEDARSRLAAMRSLAVEHDDTGYRSEAHAIKGGAGMIGASEIYLLATKAEREGLGPRQASNATTQLPASVGTSRVTAFFDQLSRACDRLERILVERL